MLLSRKKWKKKGPAAVMESTFDELKHAKITPYFFSVFIFHCLGVILCFRIMQKLLIELT